MALELRDYQLNAINVLASSLYDEGKQKALLQAATGAGKTAIIVSFIERFCDGQKVLLLMHKKELITQFITAFEKFTNITDLGIACTGLADVVLDKRITIASVQTLANRLEAYGKADLVVVDETHRVSVDKETRYKKVLNSVGSDSTKFIGITATAYRYGQGYIYEHPSNPPDSKPFFPELTHHITYKDLLESDYLMPVKFYDVVDNKLSRRLSRIKVTAGDYNQKDAGRVMMGYAKDVVTAYKKYGKEHKHVAVLACTIQHAESVEKAFTKAGYSACVIHSGLSKKVREHNIDKWQSGKCSIAVSVGILIEGFDFPGLSLLIMARPTKSPVIYVQAIGRVLRKAAGKNEALVIDIAGNVRRFGIDLDNPVNETYYGKHFVCKGRLDDGSFCGKLLEKGTHKCPKCGKSYKTYTNSLITFPEDEWLDVDDMYVDMHISAKGNKLIKVSLVLRDFIFDSVDTFICFPGDFGGKQYIEMYNKPKWEKFFKDNHYPDSCYEFFGNLGELQYRVPKRIKVRREGNFFDVYAMEY